MSGEARGYEVLSRTADGRDIVIFHHRGENLYSPNGESGRPTQPWRPRLICKGEAKRDGYKAIFYRNGRPERYPN